MKYEKYTIENREWKKIPIKHPEKKGTGHERCLE